jgi:signal transduction histidine kinase/integral membrane sensor domain MASE1/ActR/RegA family two-component response regulator
LSKRKQPIGLRDAVIWAGVVGLYFVAAKIGLLLAFVNVSVSPVWPPAGVAIAVLLWFGYRSAPGVIIGALLANYLLTDVPLVPSTAIAIGNTLEALTAVYLLRRFTESRNPFNRAFDVLKFVVFAALISTAVAATIGNLSLCISGHERWEDFRHLWLTWWSGDGVGALLVAPLLLSWLERPVERWGAVRWTEFAMLQVLMSLLSVTIYTDLLHRSYGIRPWGHLTIPLLVWAAFRFGPRGVSTALVPFAAISIWGTVHGYGGFAIYPRNEGLLLLQAYVADLAITSLALAAIVTERKMAGRHLGGSLAVTRIIAESPALDDAVPRIIQRICNTFEWEVGSMWRVDEAADVLSCFTVWPSRPDSRFEKMSKATVVSRAVGLPGRVWSTLQPAWIPDVAADDNFSRAGAASAEDLHAAFAFPIMSGEKFLGVMEFYSHEIREPDGALLATFSGIGSQIGQFLERKGAEEDREQLLSREQSARTEAEEANRLKDEFLATLSHELRTPLTAMLGWLSMLRSGRLDAETSKHALETVERNAEAQAQLIEDLVDVSRIAGGKLQLEIEPVDMITVISAAIDIVRPAANARGVSIEVSADAGVGPVAADAARLQQIIWNLLSNAVKFTPRDGHVRVSLRRFESSAELEVRDTGIGIDADFLPRVFERFRQAESALTRSHRGLGLGLAIVRHLIELHGGTVSAASDGEGNGATFTLRIPLAVHYPASVANVESAGDGDSKLTGLRILLVEDEPDARDLLALTLRISGAEVQAVDSVRQALIDLQSFKPDVLLSDIGLPIESGYDLIEKVRALPSSISKVPALALTAFATEKDRQRALASGFQMHLSKPVESRALIQAIDQLVSGRDGQQG